MLYARPSQNPSAKSNPPTHMKYIPNTEQRARRFHSAASHPHCYQHLDMWCFECNQVGRRQTRAHCFDLSTVSKLVLCVHFLYRIRTQSDDSPGRERAFYFHFVSSKRKNCNYMRHIVIGLQNYIHTHNVCVYLYLIEATQLHTNTSRFPFRCLRSAIQVSSSPWASNKLETSDRALCNPRLQD